MQRIHFGAEDLAKVQVITTLGPLAEAVFAVGMVGRAPTPHFGPWQQRLPTHLGAHNDSVQRVARALHPRYLPWLVGKALGVAVDHAPRPAVSPGETLAAVRELGRRAIIPYWRPITAYLESERDAHGRILMSAGVEGLLNTLHPRIRWQAPVLEVASDHDGDIHLGGAGILLAPSLFLTRAPAVLVTATPDSDRPVLAFGTRPDAEGCAALWGVQTRVREVIAPLLGRTRARLLREIKAGCTTGELAELLGISAACVSQHTGVLREAGLITTRRHRNTVVHSITSLGIALLGDRRARLSPHLVPPAADAAAEPAQLGLLASP